MKRRLAGGGAWAFGGKLGTAVVVLIINAILARILTADEMGAYFIVFTIVTVAALVSQMGLNQTVVRLVAESSGAGSDARARGLIKVTLTTGVVSALVMGVVIAAGGGKWLALNVFDSPAIAASVGLIALWVFAVSVLGIIAETFRGFHDIRLATAFSGLISGVISAVLLGAIWVAYSQAHLRDIIIVAVLATFSTLAFAVVLLAWKTGFLRSTGAQVRLKEVLRIACPLLVTNLTLYIIFQSDIWIIGMFRPKGEVAIYGAAARLMTLVATPLLIVNAVVPPVIAEMYAAGRKVELEKILRLVATLAGIPAFIVLILFIVLGGHILSGIFGDFYSQGALVLAILSLGQLVNVWAGSCGMTLMMTGHHGEMMTITVICGILCVAASVWVVTIYGAPGVALVCSVTLVLQNLLMTFMARKKTGIWTHVTFALPEVLQMIKR